MILVTVVTPTPSSSYDRSLGGYEIVVRLQGYLADKFTEKYPKVRSLDLF